MSDNSQYNGRRSNPSSSGGYRAPWLDMTPRFQVIWAVYFIAALAYMAYGVATGSGLPAYLERLEMDIIGMAEDHITVVLTFGLLIAALWVLTRITGRLAPSLVWAPPGAPNQSEAGLPTSSLLGKLNRPVQRVSWKAVFVITAIPLLIGAVISPVVYYSDQRNQHERIYPIDLTSGVADPPRNAKFVELTGLVARSYALSYKHSDSSTPSLYELFVPVTGEGWTPADPVRYFVTISAYEASLGKGDVEWPDAFRQGSAAHFSGKISRSLPSYVESRYRSKGLRLAPTYSVIEWDTFPDHKVSSSFDAKVAAGICLVGAGIAFFAAVMVKFLIARIRKKQAAFLAG